MERAQRNADMVQKRASKNNCCVVNCSNTYKKCPDMKLYRFPSNVRFPGRKELWINAVRRIRPNDSETWSPTANSRVCSNHFVGGSKSDHPLHPAYTPSIFPEVYKKSKKNGEQQVKRHTRFMNRNSTCSNSLSDQDSIQPTYSQILETFLPIPMDIDTPSATSEVSVQCSFSENMFSDSVSLPILFCASNNNCVSIQTNIPHKLYVQNASFQTDPISTHDVGCGSSNPFDSKDVACGPSFQTKPTLQETCKKFESIKTERELKGITGVTFAIFNLLLPFLLNSFSQKGRRKMLSNENRLLLFLMKFKTGLSAEAMGIIWGLHRTTITTIFFEVLDILTDATKDWLFWPSRTIVKQTMPPAFKKHYQKCRIIIDCTEIKTEKPSSVEQQVLLYSSYKCAHTIKFLIGITPSGYISFVSDCYGGRSSDSFITVDCGILDMVEKGDEIMSDKGFPQIKSLLDEKNIVLVMPPFSKGQNQFTPEEVEETYSIASVRIHVERKIQRIKLFRILDKIPIELMPYIDKVVHLCCVLANLQNPIIKVK